MRKPWQVSDTLSCKAQFVNAPTIAIIDIAKAIETVTRRPLPRGVALTDDTLFDELGIDALYMIEISMKLEDQLGRASSCDAEGAETLGDMLTIMNSGPEVGR